VAGHGGEARRAVREWLSDNWRTAANGVLFQAVWFGAVLGGTAWALGCLAALGLVTLQPRTAARDILLASTLVVLGGLLDSAWIRLGILDFGVPFAPVWILCMWAGVGLCVHHSLAFLRGRGLLAALLTGAAAPLCYLAGEGLGAVAVAVPWQLLGVAVAWAVLFGILFDRLRAPGTRGAALSPGGSP
jgi:hypothetical protein